MRKTMLLCAVLLFACFAVRADSLTADQIAQQLNLDTSIPLASGVALELSDNLLAAQSAASYTVNEPDSLQLSIDSVLKAISIYLWPGGPTMITDEASEPIVWSQSRIAIDTNTGVSLSPTSIDFGDTPVTTPEPTILVLLAGGYIFLVGLKRG